MKRTYYIAYGSNLNVNQMLRRCPDAVKIGASAIEDYKLVFRRGVLTIEPSEGMRVPVGVWAVSKADEESLDVYEGYPRLYVKQFFRLAVNGKTVRAMAYVMTPGYQILPPSERYRNVCAEGYADFGFDTEVLMTAIAEAQEGFGSNVADTAAAKKAVDDFARQQKDGTKFCPRCGRNAVKKRLVTNALSRHASVYVCDACGTDEAIRDFAGNPLPLKDWAIAKMSRQK